MPHRPGATSAPPRLRLLAGGLLVAIGATGLLVRAARPDAPPSGASSLGAAPTSAQPAGAPRGAASTAPDGAGDAGGPGA